MELDKLEMAEYGANEERAGAASRDPTLVSSKSFYFLRFRLWLRNTVL
jgi:hypothetical protein